MMVAINVACGGRHVRAADAEHAVQIQRRPSDDAGRCDDANDQPDLPGSRGVAPTRIAGLQILRRPAGVRGRNADDCADA